MGLGFELGLRLGGKVGGVGLHSRLPVSVRLSERVDLGLWSGLYEGCKLRKAKVISQGKGESVGGIISLGLGEGSSFGFGLG